MKFDLSKDWCLAAAEREDLSARSPELYQLELNEKHANNPEVGDGWNCLVVMDVTDTYVIVCESVNVNDKGLVTGFNFSQTNSYSREEFATKFLIRSYRSISDISNPNIYWTAHVLPNVYENVVKEEASNNSSFKQIKDYCEQHYVKRAELKLESDFVALVDRLKVMKVKMFSVVPGTKQAESVKEAIANINSLLDVIESGLSVSLTDEST